MMFVLDPMYLPEAVDLEELEAELKRRGSKIFWEYLDDEWAPRWGLRIDPADAPCVGLGHLRSATEQ